MNSLLRDSMPERPPVEKEEEKISLEPIGRGIQDLEGEPSPQEQEIISLQPIGYGVQNLEPASQSPGVKTSPVMSSFPTDGLYQYGSVVSLYRCCIPFHPVCCLTDSSAFSILTTAWHVYLMNPSYC